jgi:hypothetical protein
MEDILIHTKRYNDKTEEEHIVQHQRYVHTILDQLKENNLYLKPKKCKFKKEEVDYLKVIVGQNHVQMDPKKLKGVADYQPPTTPTEI